MLKLQEIQTERAWRKQKSLCQRCGRNISNQSYFSGPHIRGKCRPQHQVDRARFLWEVKHGRPRFNDWRWESTQERINKVPYPRQEAPFEVPPARTIKTEERDPNQLDFNLEDV